MSRDLYMVAEKHVDTGWELLEPPFLQVGTVLGIDTSERWYEPQMLFSDGGRRDLCDVLVDPGICPSPWGSFGPARGLPPDLSPILQAYVERTMEWTHTHSWLSARDLLAFDWQGRTAQVYGRVRSEYAALFEDGRPFPVGVPQGAWSWVSIGSPPDVPRIHFEAGEVQVSWVRSCAEAVGEDFLEALSKLRGVDAPDDVRVVFWFG